MISYAQNREDVVLWRVLHSISGGSYIDIGAQDPIKNSITNWFYQNGWSGINVEPVYYYYNELCKFRERDVNLPWVISNIEKPITFFEIEKTGLSTYLPKNLAYAKIHNLQTVENQLITHTLFELETFITNTEIHFMSIDVEGAEKDILTNLKKCKIRPWILIIEAHVPGTQIQSHEVWETDVIKAGYKFALADGLNRFYLHKSKLDLMKSLQYPVNVFDGFEPYQT